jgi:hypothetical protein
MVTVRLPQSQHAQLREWCAGHGFSMAGTIRGLVERFLETEARKRVANEGRTGSTCSGRVRGDTGIATERFAGTARRELLDRTLNINQQHAWMALREYQRHYNDHRPHRTLGHAAPNRPLPDRTRTEINNVRRHDRLGGLLHEYQQVA